MLGKEYENSVQADNDQQSCENAKDPASPGHLSRYGIGGSSR
jgi:hypothetical protein